MIIFRPWRRMSATLQEPVIRRFLTSVANNSKTAFEKGMQSPKSGRWHAGLPRRSSAANQYPAVQSGALLRSIRTRVTRREATIGTNMYYSRWLREGTRRMARRRMSDNALQEGISRSRTSLRGWVKWQRSRR